MAKIIKIELSDHAYELAARLAGVTGQSIEQWACSRVSSSLGEATNGSKPVALSPELLAFAGCVEIADPDWADNERIDRDLAREYESDHEDAA